MSVSLLDPVLRSRGGSGSKSVENETELETNVKIECPDADTQAGKRG